MVYSYDVVYTISIIYYGIYSNVWGCSKTPQQLSVYRKSSGDQLCELSAHWFTVQNIYNVYIDHIKYIYKIFEHFKCLMILLVFQSVSYHDILLKCCLCLYLQPAPAWTTFRVGLYCGVFLVLMVTVVITGRTNTRTHTHRPQDLLLLRL